MSKITEPFSVKHYTGEERPAIKGNGFDGLEIGTDRAEAEEFVAAVNALIAVANALYAALEVLSIEADSFSVSGVYFNEACMGHKGLDMAAAAMALADREEPDLAA